VGELRDDVRQTFEKRQRHAIDVLDGLKALPVGVPHERLRSLEVRLGRRARGKPF